MTAPDLTSERDYRAHRAINWTALKLIGRSPLHYRHALDSGDSGDTHSRMALRANHCAVLEPQHFDRDFAVFEGARRAGKEWAAFEADNADRTIIKASERDTAMAIAAAVRAHPMAARILSAGRAEVPLLWRDMETGLECKGRADWIDADGTVWDLKTVSDVSAREVARMCARMQWHAQIAHYVAGAGARMGGLIVVESAAPHDVGVYLLPAEVLALGRSIVDGYLSTVALCTAEDSWPGAAPGLSGLTLPRWAYPDDDDDIMSALEGL